MSSYGRQTLDSTGRTLQVLADGRRAEWKTGGITLDWSTVTAHSGDDLTLPDDRVVTDGEKYLRFGEIIARANIAEVQTIDLSGGDDPTAGDWDLTILGETITDIAWNVSAAALQLLIRALDVDGADEVTVGKSGFVYTITFPKRLGNVDAVTVDDDDLTGATSVVIATGTAGTGTGLFGPHRTNATDGRQTLVAGDCFILNETVFEKDAISDHPPAFDGGKVWEARLKVGDANEATMAQLKAAFPRLSYAKD